MFHIGKGVDYIDHVNYYKNSDIHYIMLLLILIKTVNYNYFPMMRMKGSGQENIKIRILLHHVYSVCPGSKKKNKKAIAQTQR